MTLQYYIGCDYNEKPNQQPLRYSMRVGYKGSSYLIPEIKEGAFGTKLFPALQEAEDFLTKLQATKGDEMEKLGIELTSAGNNTRETPYIYLDETDVILPLSKLTVFPLNQPT